MDTVIAAVLELDQEDLLTGAQPPSLIVEGLLIRHDEELAKKLIAPKQDPPDENITA